MIWHRPVLTVQNTVVIDKIDVSIHGHSSVNSPTVRHNQIWIDTLSKTGKLTVLEFKDVIKLIKNG